MQARWDPGEPDVVESRAVVMATGQILQGRPEVIPRGQTDGEVVAAAAAAEAGFMEELVSRSTPRAPAFRGHVSARMK